MSKMTFGEYQSAAAATAMFPEVRVEGERVSQAASYVYPAMGLSGEVGEVMELLKKAVRDEGGRMSAARLDKLRKELGDVLWYVAQIATECGLSLADVAEANISKLASRQERGVLGGSGDER